MTLSKNFNLDQYKRDHQFQIKHNYLQEQFSENHEIWNKINEVISKSEFTLGSAVEQFERRLEEYLGCRHAISVGSGTDALRLSLIALGVQGGDEVITSPYSFYATTAAIVTLGATPVFVDVDDTGCMDVEKIENAITGKTKAILPVHWAGKPANLNGILAIANHYKIPVVEDACHALGGSYGGAKIGTFGTLTCFSFHPLKNLNVWGDGGLITTNNDELANHLRLIRNHGLDTRDVCRVFAFNSRLDTIQAVVGITMLGKLDAINRVRHSNSKFLNDSLSKLKDVLLPVITDSEFHTFHLYSIRTKQRDDLINVLTLNGVDAKIHYPTPLHLQPAAKFLGYVQGDFPIAERISRETISLPVHEFVTKEQLIFMADIISRVVK